MKNVPNTIGSKVFFLIIFTSQIVLITLDQGVIGTEQELHGVYFSNSPNLSCSTWSCQQNNYWRPSNVRGYFRDMGCACDQYCGIVGDCCMDYNSNSDDDEMGTLDRIEPHLRCVQDSTVATEDGFLAVVSCPQSWLGSETEVLCKSDNVSDLMLRLPVTGNHSGLVYRNLYCAVCHDEPYQLWRPTVDCSSMKPLDLTAASMMDEILENQNCHLQKLTPKKEGKYRPCKPDVIKSCAPDFNDTDMISRCVSSVHMQLAFSESGGTFYNVECALCNYHSPSCLNNGVRPFGKGVRSRGFYSFSILFDLNTQTGSTQVGSRLNKVQQQVNMTHTCPRFQVYDPFIRRCRNVYTDVVVHPELTSHVTNFSHSLSSNAGDCSRLRLNGSEFAISEDGTLETVSGYVFDQSEYYYDGKFAYVCTNLTQNFTEISTFIDQKTEFNFSPMTAIITSVGLFVSLLGLMITMVIYALIKSLRNIPGKIILSLTTSLFFANLTVLFAPRAESFPTLCKVIAALMHYLFLDAFLWMNVMAADVWFTFSKSFVKAGDGGKSSKRFIFYNVYVRGVAIVLVTAAVTVDNVVSESQFKPNYGRGLCWITNKRGLLVFFASPLFLLICLNFVFFSIAAKNIHDAKRKSAIYLGKGDRSQFGIYVKLSVVMGLTWVLGFLASLFPYTVMWCIYIIFNTLQGMFICIAFVFTRRVLHSLRERFINLRRQSAASGQMPSTPTRSTVLTFKITDRVQ
ncbi:G-protein coupled receptor Mth-like [Haliotis rufescens]|uniref:G-protein coupled receptor Mth-like n=1 Tax=Haliotis rufescens TaxID=6454 RepID=UPI00201EDDF2|nr:G-protein coupled receptor Mth-like [Haliotis rufescens]